MPKNSYVGRQLYPLMTQQAVQNARYIKRNTVQEVSTQIVSSRSKAWSNGAYPLVYWKNGDALVLTQSGKFLLLKGEYAVEVTIDKSAWEYFIKVYKLGEQSDDRSTGN